MFRIPVIGRIIRGAGQIPVYRESVDAAVAVRAAIDAVERGECVVVYPEGVWYRYENKADIDEIIEEHLKNGRIVERLRI